jgi:hypothetical protein
VADFSNLCSIPVAFQSAPVAGLNLKRRSSNKFAAQEPRALTTRALIQMEVFLCF